jgi:hypothetical protein
MSTLEDKAIIDKLLSIRNQESRDWWNSVSAAEQESLEKGLADSESKELHPHAQARKLYDKWL